MTFDPAPVLFALGVVWLGYVYVGYPALLYVAGLFRRVRPRVDEEYLPPVSVLIAARNEERDIGWKIAETLAWDYPADRLQILVASDASDDRTDRIVESFEDLRVRLVRMERRGGKGRALNRLAELAAGEILFFTDANAHIGPQALRRMVRHFGDVRVGCVTGHSESLREGEANEASISAGAYWRIESLVRTLESRIGSVLVCDGAIFAIRRELFRVLDPDLANDLELPLRIGGCGHAVVEEPDAVVFEKDTSSAMEEFSRRRRICAQGLLGMWRLRSTLRGLRAWQFLSHKFLRWLTAVPIAMVLGATAWLAAEPLFGVLFAVELALVAAAFSGLLLARGGHPPGLCSAPLFILLTSIGAMAGLLDACRGRTFDVWNSPALTRGGLREAER